MKRLPRGFRLDYIKIPEKIKNLEDINAKEKLFLTVLIMLDNDSIGVDSTNEYLSKKFKVTIRSITRYVSVLIEKGYITQEHIYKDSDKQIKTRGRILRVDKQFKEE